MFKKNIIPEEETRQQNMLEMQLRKELEAEERRYLKLNYSLFLGSRL